jgi:hypothetical protein
LAGVLHRQSTTSRREGEDSIRHDSFTEAHQPTNGLERQFRAWPAAKPPTQLLGLPAHGLLERLLVRRALKPGSRLAFVER